METISSFCLGIGLSAACGFRVFVPMLVMSLAAISGHLHLSQGFAWIGTYAALITFSVATVLEVAGYYIPWLDHLLDTMATPAAIVAGTLITAAMVTDMSPMLKWTLAIIAGGGVAGIVQGTTVGRARYFNGNDGRPGQPSFRHDRTRQFSSRFGNDITGAGVWSDSAGFNWVRLVPPLSAEVREPTGRPYARCLTRLSVTQTQSWKIWIKLAH